MLTQEDGPLVRFCDLVPFNGMTLVQRRQLFEFVDRTHIKMRRPVADAKACHGPGSECIGERLGFGVDDVHGRAAQSINQHTPKRGTVVHIEPFG